MYNKNNYIFTPIKQFTKAFFIESKTKKERSKETWQTSAKLRLEKIMEVGYTGQLRDRIRKVRDSVQIAKQKYCQCRICHTDYDEIREVHHTL